jgi:hypothetical protein
MLSHVSLLLEMLGMKFTTKVSNKGIALSESPSFG